MSQPLSATKINTQPLRSPVGFRVWRPGTITYRDALACQERLVGQRPLWAYNLLILLEHPPVITLGRSTDHRNLLWPADKLEAAGIDCVKTNRGGDVTLHAPGQLVGYPIVDLNSCARDLHRFLRMLEEVIIRTLADYGLTGKGVAGKTGVWIEERKIASIGIAVKRWISYHGFALNIDNDLASFDAIIPCGLRGVTMTSLTKELGRAVNKNEVAETVITHFRDIMQSPLLGTFDDSTYTT